MISKNKLTIFFIAVLFIFGLFVPTSINNEITSKLVVVLIGIYFIVYIYMLFLGRIKVILLNVILILIMLMILILGTLIFSFQEIRLGSLIFILLFCLLCTLDLSEIKVSKKNRNFILKIFNVANFIVIVWGILLILGIPFMEAFTLKFYSAFYDELLYYMFFDNKPVTIFATHSVAGFYTYLFTLINYILFREFKSIQNLVLMLLMIIILIFLKSGTAFVFLITFLIFIYFDNAKRINVILKTFIWGIATILIVVFSQNILKLINEKLFGEYNGWNIRYGENGILFENLDWIRQHIFLGIGFNYHEKFVYGDSGIIEIFLRGGIFSLIIFYLVFFIYLYRNLNLKLTLLMFFSYLMFEVSFGNILYYRTLFILPFIILVLNNNNGILNIKSVDKENSITMKSKLHLPNK